MCTDVLMNDYVGRGKETFTYMYKECKHYTDEERLLAFQGAEDRGWRVNPSFSGIVSEKQCAVNVKCNRERSANVHVPQLNCTEPAKKGRKERK